jgi:putative transposase
MAQSLSQVYLHVVFSTKNRQRFLQDRGLRERTHAYLAGACRNLGSPSIIVGGVEDYVHILCRLAKTLCISDLIRELKRESSKWLKDQSPDLSSFFCQGGYGAFSISPGHVEDLTRDIARQEDHHKKETFQKEFRRLLGLYGIEFDERYVWD